MNNSSPVLPTLKWLEMHVAYSAQHLDGFVVDEVDAITRAAQARPQGVCWWKGARTQGNPTL